MQVLGSKYVKKFCKQTTSANMTPFVCHTKQTFLCNIYRSAICLMGVSPTDRSTHHYRGTSQFYFQYSTHTSQHIVIPQIMIQLHKDSRNFMVIRMDAEEIVDNKSGFYQNYASQSVAKPTMISDHPQILFPFTMLLEVSTFASHSNKVKFLLFLNQNIFT